MTRVGAMGVAAATPAGCETNAGMLPLCCIAGVVAAAATAWLANIGLEDLGCTEMDDNPTGGGPAGVPATLLVSWRVLPGGT